MFRVEEIQARLREKPFRPLRLIATEGLRYDIRHPDLVMVGERDLTIGFASPNRPTVYNRLIRVAIIHLVGIEDLEEAPTATPPTNGTADHP